MLTPDVELPAGEVGLSPASRLASRVPVPTADKPRVRATLSDSALPLSTAVTGNKVLVTDKGVRTARAFGSNYVASGSESLIPRGVVREQPLSLGTVCESQR